MGISGDETGHLLWRWKHAHLAAADRVIYLDIGARFLDRHGGISTDVLFDYLHPTARGYRIWAEAMEPTLRTLLGDYGTPGQPTPP